MILPICLLVIGYLLVISTTQGEGSAIGFRALGVLIALPAVVLSTFGINLLIAFPWQRSRTLSFVLGMLVPVSVWVAEYVYLWELWRQFPDIS